MYEKQHTLAHAVSVEGFGVHTGEPCVLTLKPAPENHGFVFKRMDLPGAPEIPALVEYAIEGPRSTVLMKDDAAVMTTEHVLAALTGLQYDNCLIELTGPELPILDGSAQPYLDLLRSAGIQEQAAHRNFFTLDTPLHYTDEAKKVELTALPLNEYRLTVLVDYETEVLGAQTATLYHIEEFEKTVGKARTFCFVHDIEPLLKANLIKGGSLDNALVFVDKIPDEETKQMLRTVYKRDMEVSIGILDKKDLHEPNEPALHKLMDLVGDLALVGGPIKGHIVASRPGHASNVAFARKLVQRQKTNRLIEKIQPRPTDGYRFDVIAIQRMLPHRFPFLMIDRITYMDEKVVEGYKNVSVNEPFFQGHFPGNPVLPGVLQLEALAQVGGILVYHSVPDPDSLWMLYMGVDNCRFKKPVVPGDQLVMRVEMLNLRRNIIKMKGQAFVNEVLVCEAELMAGLVPKDPKDIRRD